MCNLIEYSDNYFQRNPEVYINFEEMIQIII